MDTGKGTKFTTVPDEIKAKVVADLQGLPQLAADAQHKMPKMFMVAVERATNPSINASANDDANMLLNVIQFVSPATSPIRLELRSSWTVHDDPSHHWSSRTGQIHGYPTRPQYAA